MGQPTPKLAFSRKLHASLLFASCLISSACTAPINRDRLHRGVTLADDISNDDLHVAPIQSSTLSGKIRVAALIERAKRHNASLMRAGYSALVARSQRDEVIAQIFFPKLSMQGTYYSRSNQPATVANFGGGNVRIPTGQKSALNYQATVRQPLLSVSDFVFRSSAAIYQAKASKLNFRRTWQEVRRAVLSTIFQHLELQSQLQGIDALLVSLREQERRASELAAVGAGIENDVFKVQVEIAGQEQNKVELQNAIASSQVLLCTLVGASPYSKFTLEFDREIPANARVPSVGEAYGLALRHRPDLMGLELGKKSQRQLVMTEWTSYIPRVDASLDYQYSDAAQLAEDDFFSYTLIASIDLFDVARHARIGQAHARIGELEGQGLELERQIRVDLETGCRAVANELSRLKQSKIQEKASKENFKVTKNRVSNGLGTINDELEAAVTVTRAEISSQRARFAYFRALAELDSLIGLDGYYLRGAE